MPSVIRVAKDLENKYLNYVPTTNQDKHVIHMYNNRGNVPKHIVERTVVALYLPSAVGRVGKKGKPDKAEEIYEDILSIYQNNKADREDDRKTLRFTDKLIERKERLTGTK